MHIGIIGGGAAGMMAGAAIIESNPQATISLIDGNASLGKKVIISGGGRCNVTTGVRPLRTVFNYYPRGARFLRAAFHHFPPESVYEWFEGHGVPLKIEKDLRVFPQSNDGKDIVGVFERLFAEHNVNLLLQHTVDSVSHSSNGTFSIHFKEHPSIQVDKLILATGGQAYRHTGSVGDGYAFAESLGHTVSSLGHSLSSLLLEEQWPKELTGVSFENARLVAESATAEYEFSGAFVFTHQGISGPAVFALSAQIAFESITKKSPLTLYIDFLPGHSFEELRKKIQHLLQEFPKQHFSHVLSQLFPKRLAMHALQEVGVDPQIKNAVVSKRMLHQTITWIKKAPLHIIGRGAGSEFVTAGGVALDEVNPNTMESLKCPGLYFAGELLNVDGFTGGFNLQASWATGRLAGENAIKIDRRLLKETA